MSSFLGSGQYELCVDYLAIYHTGWIELPRFRELMGTESKYPMFLNFNRWVIKPAVKEINAITDLSIEAEYKRQGRGAKVVAIRFNIQRKSVPKQIARPKSDTQETLTGITKELHDRGVNPKSAVQLVKDYPEERVQKAISLFDTGVIKVAGGIRRAIEEEWEPSEKQQEQVDNVEAVKEQETLEKQAEAIQMQRVAKALNNFPSKDEWVNQRVAERKMTLSFVKKTRNESVTQQELEEIRQEEETKYPESKESQLEYIHHHLDRFDAEPNEIVKELEQEK